MSQFQRNRSRFFQVKKIHILCENDQAIEFILHNFTLDTRKLVMKNIGHRLLYSEALDYVSNQLLHETSIIMNADIYLGKGFDKLDPNILKQGTIYALTRHEDPERLKACPGVEEFCGNKSIYIGSHDAFVMHLVRPIPDKVIQIMKYRPNISGSENALIYMLEKHGQFRFKNPCSILHVIHHHCSTYRNLKYAYVEGKKLYRYFGVPAGLAPFSGL